MPQGRTHDKITLITSPIVFAITLGTINDISLTFVLFLSYLFSSFMFNGDLDILSKPYNRWWIFKFVWIPYQKMFKHRSVFTHGIIVGTIIRLIYVGIILYPILYYFNLIDVLLTIPAIFYVMLFIGLELGNMMHTLADKIF